MPFSTPLKTSTLGVVAALCPGAAVPAADLARTDVREAIACVLGAERAERDRPTLRADDRLERAAQRHAADMARRGYFSHVSPGGESVLDRIRRTGWAGRASVRVGEILARGSGRGASAAAFRDAWMASAGHREIVLDRRYEQVGVGVAADGERRRTIVAVTFGRRR